MDVGWSYDVVSATSRGSSARERALGAANFCRTCRLPGNLTLRYPARNLWESPRPGWSEERDGITEGNLPGNGWFTNCPLD